MMSSIVKSSTFIMFSFLLIAIFTAIFIIGPVSGTSCTADSDCADLKQHYFCNDNNCNCKIFYRIDKNDNSSKGCQSIKCTSDNDCKSGQRKPHNFYLECNKDTSKCQCQLNILLNKEETSCVPPLWVDLLILVILVFCVCGCICSIITIICCCCCLKKSKNAGGSSQVKESSSKNGASKARGDGLSAAV